MVFHYLHLAVTSTRVHKGVAPDMREGSRLACGNVAKQVVITPPRWGIEPACATGETTAPELLQDRPVLRNTVRPEPVEGGLPRRALTEFPEQPLRTQNGNSRNAKADMTVVIAGRVEMTLATILSSDQFVKTNRLRPLAVTSPKRSALMPLVRAIPELGYPGYDVALWCGIVAPGHTPTAIVNRLNAALCEATKETAFRARMAASDAEILVRSPQEFGEFLSRDRVKCAGAAKCAKVQLDQ